MTELKEYGKWEVLWHKIKLKMRLGQIKQLCFMKIIILVARVERLRYKSGGS